MLDDNSSIRAREVLQNLSSQLGGSYDGGEVKVTIDDVDFYFFIYLPVREGKQLKIQGLPLPVIGVPSFFELKTNIPYPHPGFSIRKSDSIDLVAEHIFGSRDYQVDDNEFNSEFYIRLHNDEWGSKFFSDNTRKCLSELFALGFDLVKSEDGELKTIKHLQLGSSLPDADFIATAIEKIKQIISVIPEVYSRNDAMELKFHEKVDRKNTRLGCLVILLLSILVAIAYFGITRWIGLLILNAWQ